MTKKTSGMGMAADIDSAIREATKKWTKTRKSEERRPASRQFRGVRMRMGRRTEWGDVMTPELMTEAYMKTSGGGTLPAEARQFMYSARPALQKAARMELNDQYFTKTLLPKFMADNPELTEDWDVVFGARGHFKEPHADFVLGLGTIEVREYLASLHDPKQIAAFLKPAGIEFRGPSGSFGGLCFIEKEGFDPLLQAAQIAERLDIATMSTKGTSVTAARHLADIMCDAYDIPLLPLRDMDYTGFSIANTLHNDTWRYEFQNTIEVIPLGLSLIEAQAMGLQEEYQQHTRGKKERMIENMRENGATEAEIEFMFRDFTRERPFTRRIELNAMTSPQFVSYLERKLKAAGMKKIVPEKVLLSETYRMYTRGCEAERIIKPQLKKLESLAVPVPRDLEKRVRAYLKKHPAARWDAAVDAIVRKKTGVKAPSDATKTKGQDPSDVEVFKGQDPNDDVKVYKGKDPITAAMKAFKGMKWTRD